MILVLWRGSALVRNGDLAVTDLALVCLAVLGLWDAFGPVPRGLAGIGQTARAAGRVVPRLSVLDDNPPATSPFVPCAFFRAPSQGEILLEMKDMSFAWPGGRRPVLYNVDLVLRAGDRVMLTAPSGAGKSTLLMLAAGHLLPSSGLVRPGSMDSRTRHRSVALLSQRSTIFAGSVAENLRLASPGASNDDLWRVLDAAGLRDHVGGLRDGLDGMLGEAGMSLSGGQARRLAIARVLLRDPAVLLLDEPTEGIEDQLAAEIMLAISRSLPRASIVFSMHRALEHDIGQRRLRLCDGRLKMHAESAASVRCETISVPTDHDTRSASRFRMVSGTGSF